MAIEQYLYAPGLRRLAERLRGDERVHAGARPYGLHAGNRLPLVVYPILLARALRARGVEPRFSYTLTLNDWESDTLDHPDGHELNLIPKGRSFQYQPDPDGCHPGRVDHWQAALERELAPVREAMPQGQVKVTRASSLRDDADFLSVLRFGLQRPRAVREIAQQTLEIEVLEKPLQFAGPVCRRCRSIEGTMEYIEGWDRVQFRCASCGNGQEADIREQDYWGYVHLIGAAKNAALKPDVWIFGGDFLQYKTVDFHTAVYERALGRPLEQAHLFTPVLLGPDGRKMSKSLGNKAEVPLARLLAVAEGWEKEAIALAEVGQVGSG